MSCDLGRMLRPRSVAVVGGGPWCRQVLRQLHGMGFSGDIWRVHPDPASVEGVAAVASVADLPGVPDAAFIGVNRHLTVQVVSALAQIGAGGAVCFASGFSEATGEDGSAHDLQSALVAAAGDMPILGPNCYGFINALDGALLWPDQHGCVSVERGVAILTQSSNIAINLTMQQRGLPIAFVGTCGNMAQTSQADMASALLDDPRITAIGLHIEGFGDTAAWHALAMKAHARGVPLVALKAGMSEEAQRATLSHTASLAGSDAGAAALLARLGVARVHDLPGLLESLKLLHVAGPLETSALSSISCSGGEASLAADAAMGMRLSFPALEPRQKTALQEVLGPMVALSNPLDYHTYIWGDAEKMAAAWTPMAAAHIGLVLILVDYPHTDAADWHCATKAAIATHRASGRPVAVVSTLPELMPAEVAATLMQAGVTPLFGLREAMVAAEAAAHLSAPCVAPPLVASPPATPRMLKEAEAKDLLQSFGVAVPVHVVCEDVLQVDAKALRAPLALKAQGIAHKSEAGGVRLGLSHGDLPDAARTLPNGSLLIEEMVQGGIAELLIGVTVDAAHGYVLTLGTGGVLTELWQDSVSLLLPVTEMDVRQALCRLKTYPLLTGFRGKPPIDLSAIVETVMALQRCVIAHQGQIAEVEINPLICTPTSAVAADALMVLGTSAISEGDRHEPDQNCS
ncbi:acetate--CoA ligase family protein [uncultured Roseobacter sp.]|uniref:acetate--CoA ligase family protein n=1 Tax=uncultured Roseobacter sp. TaxID=114847 RepID=UPI003458F1C4